MIRHILSAAVFVALAAACTTAASGPQVLEVKPDTSSKKDKDKDKDDKTGPGSKLDGTPDETPGCEDECILDQKRCKDASKALVEVCARATDGCTHFKQI